MAMAARGALYYNSCWGNKNSKLKIAGRGLKTGGKIGGMCFLSNQVLLIEITLSAFPGPPPAHLEHLGVNS